MRLSVLAATLLSACAAIPALADEAPASTFTGNLGVASEYTYRGLAQSNNRPAVQGGFDYAHSSGFYIGNWNSSISWIGDAGLGASAATEMDFYGGYKKTIGDFSFDVGSLYYYYPGNYGGSWTDAYSKPNTLEFYGAVGWKWFTAKYSVATTSVFGNRGSNGSGYAELNFAYDLGQGWGLAAHAGHQQVKDVKGASYSDYKLGVSKDWGVVTTTASYTMTTANKDFYYNSVNSDLGKSRLSLLVGKTF